MVREQSARLRQVLAQQVRPLEVSEPQVRVLAAVVPSARPHRPKYPLCEPAPRSRCLESDSNQCHAPRRGVGPGEKPAALPLLLPKGLLHRCRFVRELMACWERRSGLNWWWLPRLWLRLRLERLPLERLGLLLPPRSPRSTRCPCRPARFHPPSPRFSSGGLQRGRAVQP